METMRISLKVIIYFMIAGVIFVMSVMGQRNKCTKDVASQTMKLTCSTEDNARIECDYGGVDEYVEPFEKFFCKGETFEDCDKLISIYDGNREVTEGRFSIKNDKKNDLFKVSIRNLSTDDTDFYWCGVEDIQLTQIFLVVEKRVNNKPSKSDGTNHRPGRLTSGITAAVAMIALSLLTLLLVVKLRCALSRISVSCERSVELRTNTEHNTENTEESNVGHEYEEIDMQNQQRSPGAALPSVNATVDHPAKQLCCATVSQAAGNAASDTDTKPSPACEYASISGPRGDAQPPAE